MTNEKGNNVALGRSGFGVGVILTAIGVLEIEPQWVKGVLLIAAFLGTMVVYNIWKPSQPGVK